MPVIVLEGPDLSGKSTFARELVTQHSHSTILKQGPPSHYDIFEQYLRACDVFVANPTKTYILDRWHVGELIYGPLLRGESKLTKLQARYIDMVLQTFGATFIVCVRDIPTLYDRYDIRGDNIIKKEWLPHIVDEYWHHVQKNPHWVAQVVGGPKRYTEETTPSPFLGRYVGPISPRVLLLGDERANKSWSWPFVPYRATSGHWLLGALESAKIDHMQVGLFNACESNPAELHLLYGQLGWPPVVTLGRNAEKAWRESWGGEPRPYTYLNHPQYARRFQYTSFESYGNQIKEIIDE